MEFFAFIRQPVKEKENSESKIALLSLNIELVIHSVRGREVGKIHRYDV